MLICFSMQLLKWFSLMKEVVMCDNNLTISLLKHRNFDFAVFRAGGVTLILNLIFGRVG